MKKIKWRKKDEELLKKKVKSYNDKIRRNMKKGVDERMLPEKIKYRDIKNSIETRKEFNREVEILDTFLSRYALNVADKSTRGAILPVWKKQQVEIKLKAENEVRKEQRKAYEKLQATDRNKPIGKTVKEDADNLAVANLRDRKFNFKNMSQKELELFMESLGDYNTSKEKRNERYKQNYIKVIQENINPDLAEKLIEIIEKIDTDVLVEKYYTDRNLTIDFIYEPQEQEMAFNVLFDTWNEILDSRK